MAADIRRYLIIKASCIALDITNMGNLVLEILLTETNSLLVRQKINNLYNLYRFQQVLILVWQLQIKILCFHVGKSYKMDKGKRMIVILDVV